MLSVGHRDAKRGIIRVDSWRIRLKEAIFV